MPVATHAGFRHLSVEEAHATGAKVLLSNTFHLMLRPGIELFQKLGGIHRFMGWEGPVLTDSGGFQIFSLSSDLTVYEKGAQFRSIYDNSRRSLTPESSIQMQQAIDSDIMMVLDVCIDSTTDEAGTRAAMERTHRWALRSLLEKEKRDTGQALFGIVQGGVHQKLRDESAAFLTQHPFDGFAIGGLAVGETKHEREEMTQRVTAQLPRDKPRYLMGVGTPVDLLEAVRRGVDMFDCIIPTKMAQQGYAYTFDGLVRVSREVFRHDETALEEGCDCATCARYPKAYLNHLFKGGSALGSRLLSVHNVRLYQRLMHRMRQAIHAGQFDAVQRELLARLAK
jgi:queuine tRNA-ribosyltransferase